MRLTPEGADFKAPKRFRQELDLPSGSIRIEAEAPDGKLCLYPCNGLELVLKATNPIETVAALRAVVGALLVLPELSASDRGFLQQVQPTLPELPLAEKQGRKILNLADKWEGLANGWDVDFKLHAPQRTVVECGLKGGNIVKLTVTPESRRKDVVIVPNQTKH